MCPEGGNENEYHFCPAHWQFPPPEEGDFDDEQDPFAFVPTGRPKTL